MTGALNVVGIGASAGGVEAMLGLFAAVRTDSGAAYVIAQHMAPNGHDDLVVKLLARETRLPVVLAQAVEALRPDTVFVIPSGRDGVVQGDALILAEPEAGSISTPSINRLFASIAQAAGRAGAGVVLSGTGLDGVNGCRALKNAGALTLAQLPGEAKFDGMPDAAIAARVIDETLPVEAIAARLAAHFAPPPGVPRAAEQVPAAMLPEAAGELAELLLLIHRVCGIDYSCYKEETLLRRLDRRRAALGLERPGAYLDLVRRQPEELHCLQHLFLVSVSSFFRDRASFRQLELALGGALQARRAPAPLQVWVPGCASGEEVYTLAVIINELLADPVLRQRVSTLRIVGTDLNPDALAVARAGLYRQTAFEEMAPASRAAWFEPHGQHCAVGQRLRAGVEFEQRDVLGGPPAGMADNIDLISCRNLLIYMKSDLQDRLVAMFHHALRPGGLLFLGLSESLTLRGNALYSPVDHYHRLFSRRR